MGYETTFKLNGELDNMFKSTFAKPIKEEEVNKYKHLLIAICMSMDCDNTSVALYHAHDAIKFSLQLYISELVEMWKQNLKAQINDEGEVYFCGWEHSNTRDCPWTDESLLDYYLETLFYKAIIKVPSPYSDKGDSEYNNKLTEISDNVKEIEDCVWSLWDSKFIERYRGSEDATEDESY